MRIPVARTIASAPAWPVDRALAWSLVGALASALVWGPTSFAAGAEESADPAPTDAGVPAEAGAPADAGTTVGLDALFRLPSDAGPGRRPSEGAASDRQRWEQRFASIRADLAEARGNLSKAQDELEEIARSTDAWQMAAPGATHDPETSPISYKLRSDIRRYREDINRAEKRLRELEVEASLAGVPAEWRRPPHEDASPDS